VQHLLLDAGQAISKAAYSSCAADRPATAPASHADPAVPPKLAIELELDSAIDLDTAAAGDLISATVIKPVVAPHTQQPVVLRNAKARGRILNVEHRTDAGRHFYVAISFDTIESEGSVMPVHLVLDREISMPDARSMRSMTDGPRVELVPRWPEQTLIFPDTRHTIPSGYQSRWVTTK
jgi:hypothetical protein